MQITCVPSCLFTWQLDRDTNAFSGPLLTPGHATQKGIVPLNSTTSGSTVRINRLVSASSILNSTFIKTTPKLDLTNLSSGLHISPNILFLSYAAQITPCLLELSLFVLTS
ncbi:unnamed protein product [Hymenolepis diminuta]|uniref:Uncharacterized protein n=1 Tax=Hymenolepis diminuta TaxID=6216 RepID=A0A564Y9L8_HYMDI|nr:unnamed protein product [Hymenolepis diminuta]